MLREGSLIKVRHHGVMIKAYVTAISRGRNDRIQLALFTLSKGPTTIHTREYLVEVIAE